MPRFIAPRRLSSAIAVGAAYSQLGLFVGPALAGWIILRFGTPAAFASNVLGYGLFFLSVAAMRTPAGYRQERAVAKHFARDVLDGVAAIWAHGGIKAILMLLLFGDGLYGAVRQMAPAFADRALGAGVGGLSTLLASAGVGATIAALWLAHGGVARASPTTILWGFLGFVAAVSGLMLSRRLGEAALAMAALGACFEVCRTGALALLAAFRARRHAGPHHEHLVSADASRRRDRRRLGRRRSRRLGPQSSFAVRRGAGVSGLGRRLLPSRPDSGRIRFASRPGG